MHPVLRGFRQRDLRMVSIRGTGFPCTPPRGNFIAGSAASRVGNPLTRLIFGVLGMVVAAFAIRQTA